MAPSTDRPVRRVPPPVTHSATDRPPLPPATIEEAQSGRWDRFFAEPQDGAVDLPRDHHVRLTERHCVGLLRSVGWVYVAGTSAQAPSLIRPRRLDHLGGC